MDALWAGEQPLAVRDVRERMQYGRPVAYPTVMTVLTILHGKGVLCREKHGRAWRYWPRERRAEHDARLMAEILRSGADTAQTAREFAATLTAEELRAFTAQADCPRRLAG